MPEDFNISKNVPPGYQPYRPLIGEAPDDCINLDISCDDSMEFTEEGQSDLADAKSSSKLHAGSTEEETIGLATSKPTDKDGPSDLADAKSSSKRGSTEDDTIGLATSKPTDNKQVDLVPSKSSTVQKASDLDHSKSTKSKKVDATEDMEVDVSPKPKRGGKMTSTSQNVKKKRPKLNFGRRHTSYCTSSRFYEQKKPEKFQINMTNTRNYVQALKARGGFSSSARISCVRIYDVANFTFLFMFYIFSAATMIGISQESCPRLGIQKRTQILILFPIISFNC